MPVVDFSQPPDSGSTRRQVNRQLAPFLWLIFFLVLDFVAPFVLDNAQHFVTLAIFSGIFLAQLGILATWAVFSKLNFLARMTIGIAATALLYSSFILGVGMIEGPRDLTDFLSVTLMIPFVFLCAQGPLWCLIVVAKTRDRDASATIAPHLPRKQFQIVHVIVATSLIAVALGLARIWAGNQRAADAAFFWAALAEYGVVFFGISAVTVLPCAWIALISQGRKGIPFGVALLALSIPYVAILILILIFRPAASMSFSVEIIFGVWCLFGSLDATLFFLLTWARRCGVLAAPLAVPPSASFPTAAEPAFVENAVADVTEEATVD